MENSLCKISMILEVGARYEFLVVLPDLTKVCAGTVTSLDADARIVTLQEDETSMARTFFLEEIRGVVVTSKLLEQSIAAGGLNRSNVSYTQYHEIYYEEQDFARPAPAPAPAPVPKPSPRPPTLGELNFMFTTGLMAYRV
ncbi:hypothetical protein cym2001_36720 [Pseudomonas sp. CYM-20-01]|uniref:hypothetical protein n=1 Tax=Pseudomonas sp. CYM-20-01 TaxID=2870750 RepID=UPI00205D881A|nr:hypothetical protein [Pseudomonas sp. CYM-20-01]BDB20307.1 hypothetical protein cym2001_36720 [Pseudomonas sp. CYM-20-01]